METHDFTAAKVGDKVSHPIYGNGVIDSTGFLSEEYPIRVQFGHKRYSFTKSGIFYIGDTAPTLYHGHNTFQIIATPVSPYKEGEWIAVLHGEDWKLGRYIGIAQDGWATVRFNGDDETMPPCNYKYHKSLTELNAELNNK